MGPLVSGGEPGWTSAPWTWESELIQVAQGHVGGFHEHSLARSEPSPVTARLTRDRIDWNLRLASFIRALYFPYNLQYCLGSDVARDACRRWHCLFTTRAPSQCHGNASDGLTLDLFLPEHWRLLRA